MCIEEMITEIAHILCSTPNCNRCIAVPEECEYMSAAKFLYKCGYRKGADLLKEFVKFIKDSWAGEIKFWEKQLEISSAFSCERKAIEQKLISMRKMIGLLDRDLEVFLEIEKQEE